MRKRLTSIILDGQQFAFFDNINEVVRGSALAAMLTARVWSDRILGKSRLVNQPVETSWIVAGNNLQFSREILLRTLFIDLITTHPRPWERKFKSPEDPEKHIREHRREAVWACLILIRNWLAKSQPLVKPLQPLGGFEEYTQIMGGILDAAGIEGFMSNVSEIQDGEDYDTEVWGPFLHTWWRKYQTTALGTLDICVIDPTFMARPNEDLTARSTRFGHLMKRIQNRVYELRNDPRTETDDRRYVVRVIPAKNHKVASGRWQIGGYQLEVLKGRPDKVRTNRELMRQFERPEPPHRANGPH